MNSRPFKQKEDEIVNRISKVLEQIEEHDPQQENIGELYTLLGEALAEFTNLRTHKKK